MTRVQIAEGNVQDMPDHFMAVVQRALAQVGLPDETGQWSGVLFKAALDPDYEDRVLTSAQSGDPDWQKVVQAQQLLSRPYAVPAPVQETPQPRAAARGSSLADMMAPSIPRRVPQQNPAGLAALVSYGGR